MVNFIVCDDDIKYRNMVKDIITAYMMKNSIEYKVNVYEDYNRDFLDIVEKKMPFKIYILDIETPTRSGIDIARIIRNKDVDSLIIFLTGHQELGEIVIKDDFLFLSFINKFDNCRKRLEAAIDKSLKFLKTKKTIKFKDGSVIYTIALEDILYITRDSVERKSIIKTDYSTFKIGKNLMEIKSMLTENFIQTHRAGIVNKPRIASYNKAKRIITFDNGEKTDLVSTRFDKELL